MKTNMTTTLSAQQLAAAFRYATDWFAVFVEEINALNVYPVPDGDTGTNMHLTLQSVRRELDLADDSKLEEVCKAISYGSLLGARGNSGVITSQILKGMVEVLRQGPITASQLIKAFEEGKTMGYKAVKKPVEGTILTVARGLAAGASSQPNASNIEEVLAAALLEGKAYLQTTPDLLPQLKAAGVVDSGGAGLIYFIEGLQGYINNTPLPAAPTIEKYAQTTLEQEEFGYCTEFLLQDCPHSLDTVREAVEPFGNSLLVVGAEGFVKGHIHTNNPDGLLAAVGRFGTMVRTKVEDMTQQHNEILSMTGAADQAPPACGLVVVAAGWGITKAFRGLGARMVSGGQTANPSVQDLLDAIKSIPSPEVIVLPNNSNVLMSAKQAAELSNKQVHVLPTTTVGAGMAAAVMFMGEYTATEQLERMQEAIQHVQTLEVTLASRTVELNNIQITQGQPIGLLNDKLCLVADTPEQALHNLIAQCTQQGEYEVLTVFYSTSANTQTLQQDLDNTFPDLSIELYAGGPDLYHYTAILE